MTQRKKNEGWVMALVVVAVLVLGGCCPLSPFCGGPKEAVEVGAR